ncbi:hypothetical protein OH768_53630 [Streptomyces sp. NBC_01622]|uniref:hypothetical protein n=1 Tax=Streptomyces sp. NBC_01622 TaxID=2975903 RepID=UPI003865A02D|nr:hypothetical protein OH768_53630 [Streptomyces sp. NBC_01622]
MTITESPTAPRVDTSHPTPVPWRVWVTHHRLPAALLAGLVATQMATIVGYFLPGVGLAKLDWNMVNGAVYTPGASPMAQFVSGGFFHYLDGIVFTVLFVVAVHPRLPWRDTAAGNLAKALVFGTALALVSLVFMTPRVYGPALGADAGFFSHHFGWKFIVSVFVWHAVYAVHLGLIYNPSAQSPDTER